MSKDLVPFWEEAYQDENTVAFSSEPNATVKEFEHLLGNQSKIIDIGCGEGQNAFYLAKQGYCNVNAFDISEHAIAKLRQKCEKEGIRLNAFTADLTTYQFEHKYDMIMSFGTLHFVQKKGLEGIHKQSKGIYQYGRNSYHTDIYGYGTRLR